MHEMRRFIAKPLAAAQTRIASAMEQWKENDHPVALVAGAFALGLTAAYVGVELFVPGGYENLPSFEDQAQTAAGFILKQVGILPAIPETPVIDLP